MHRFLIFVEYSILKNLNNTRATMNWFRKKHDIDHFYQKIEQEVQDDMAMFLEFGEEYFSLEELEMLYSQWELSFNKTDKWRGRFVLLCTGSFFMLPMTGLLMMLGYQTFLPIFLFAFPILFVVGVGGFIALYLKYGRLAYQESIGRRLKFAIRNKRKKRGYPKDHES